MFTNIRISNIEGIYGTIIYDYISPTKKKDKKDTIRPINTVSVNKIAATIGANAAGKSSVVEAIAFLISFISQIEIIEKINTFNGEINDTEKDDIKNHFRINVPEIRNKDRLEENSEISFGIYIPLGEKPGLYEYKFIVNNNKIQETLIYKKSITSKISKQIEKYESNNIRSNIGYKYTFKDNIVQDYEKVDIKLADDFRERISYINTFYEYFTEKVHVVTTAYKIPYLMLIDFIEKNEQVFKEFVNIVDDKICNFKIKENKEDKSKEIIFILEDGTEIDYYDISTGTKRMIKMFGVIYNTLLNNGVVICDEIEISLHRELVQFILKMFIANNNYSQLLFTTHDPYVFSFDNIRNDQIYFLKNTKLKSELININDINPRADYSFTKNYYNNIIFAPRPNVDRINNFCKKYFN